MNEGGFENQETQETEPTYAPETEQAYVPETPETEYASEPNTEQAQISETEPAYVPETEPTFVPETEPTFVQETEPVQETEIQTEAPTEPETEKKVLLWNEDDADRIVSELSDFAAEFPKQEGFSKEKMIPLPAQGRWLLVEDGEIIREAAFEDDGTGFLHEVPIPEGEELNPEKDENADGLYSVEAPNGETARFMLFIASDGRFAFVPADENGRIPEDAASLAEKTKELYGKFRPAEEQATENEDAQAEETPAENPEVQEEPSDGFEEEGSESYDDYPEGYEEQQEG